jgi:AcrR family transcriptional regulator
MPEDRPATRRVLRPTVERRAEIVASALAILRERGAAALTARAVAARAGLALGQVSYHFASMEELLVETYRAASADLQAIKSARLSATTDGAMARLADFLRAGFTPQVLSADYLNLQVELWAAARHHPALAETERALYDSYRAQLDALLAGIGPGDVQPVSDAIMAMLDGLWLDWLRRANVQAVENGLNTCLSLAATLAAAKA